jgi:hypothetical protein
MADPLSVLGGIASCAQLLGMLLDTSRSITNICKEARNALVEVRKIRTKLDLLCKALQRIRQDLGSFDNQDSLSPELWCLIDEAIKTVEGDVKELCGLCDKAGMTDGKAIGFRIKYALIHRRPTMALIQRLNQSEGTLTWIIASINL